MRPALLHTLDAWQTARLLARRELSAADLMRACLDQVAAREPEVRAFAHLDPDAAMARARALDAGPLRGPLHGLPLGVKDLFDTQDLPSAYGSPVYAGQRPPADAAAVALCRAAGAVVAGKTVTTEFAYFHPGPTRNPHQAGHTPGGSSSGSAAAVGAQMLPLALGTQTAGSIIRPAAYCGVVGFKPSVGRVPRAGIKALSDTLDTVGGFGRSVRDAALLGAVLLADNRLLDLPSPGQAPRIGLCRTPHWDQADADTRRAWDRAVAVLGAAGAGLADADLAAAGVLPADLVGLQKALMACEMARMLAHEHLTHRDSLSTKLLALLDEGAATTGAAHAELLATTWRARRQVDALFDRTDALLTPSATGEAPAGLDATGDPLFCRPWTLLGLPCVHLPFATGAHGLPVGLQLVGRWGDDHRLLATAAWLHPRLLQGGVGA